MYTCTVREEKERKLELPQTLVTLDSRLFGNALQGRIHTCIYVYFMQLYTRRRHWTWHKQDAGYGDIASQE